MRRNWSRLLAVGGGIALMALVLCPSAEARGRGGSSPFVKTPYGYFPKSQMYGQYMTPSALQKQLAAEKSAYDKMQKGTQGQTGTTAGGKKVDPKKKPADPNKVKK